MIINWKIEKLLEKKAKTLGQFKVFSTWFLKDNYIYIVTTRPGYWIGKGGKDVFSLNEQIAKICNDENLPKLTVRFIESGHSLSEEKKEEPKKEKFFKKKPAYSGNTAFLIYESEDDERPDEIIISDYAIEGAEDILESFGYRNRGWVADEQD